MVYSKPPHLNPFPAEPQAPLTSNQQKLADALQLANENDRIKNFIQTNKDKKKEETEKISDEMGHNDKIVRHAEPANCFPEDEKTEQRIEDEKKEMHKRRIEGMDGNYIKDLEKDLKNCRSTLASVEYSEGARLAEVRKRLHGAKELEGRTFEESTSLRSARDHYQRTLDRLKKAKIEELEKKNLPEAALRKEMAELIKYFGFCEVIEMNNAEKDAKAESHLGANIAKKCWGALEKTSNWYNKLPLFAKLGLSGAAVVAGAAGAIGFVGAKRVLSGVVAGVGTAKGLDALHQRSVGKTADRDVEKIIEEMDKVKFNGTDEENKERRHKLMIDALNVKLENVDARLKRQGMVSLCNKFIGVSIGIFLGSGMASKAIAGAWEYFHPTENVPSISLKSYENFKEINSSEGIAGKDLVAATMAAGHEAPVDVNAPVGTMDITQSLNQVPAEKVITIKEGSNFSKTLLNEFRNPDSDVYKYHPELKGSDPQELVKRVLMDFKDTHPEMEGHNPDFVAANSEIHFNPASLHADMNEGQYGWYENTAAGSGDGTHEVLSSDGVSKPSINNVADASKAPAVTSEAIAKTADTIPFDAEHDFQKLETEMNLERNFKIANANYNEAAMDANLNPGAPGGPSDVQYARMGAFDKDKAYFGWLLDTMRAEDAPWAGTTDIGELIKKGAGTKQILGSCLNKITEGNPDKVAFWASIKDQPLGQIKFGENMKSVASIIAKFQQIVGPQYADQIIPKKDLTGNMTEKTGAWLARITKLALNVKK